LLTLVAGGVAVTALFLSLLERPQMPDTVAAQVPAELHSADAAVKLAEIASSRQQLQVQSFLARVYRQAARDGWTRSAVVTPESFRIVSPGYTAGNPGEMATLLTTSQPGRGVLGLAYYDGTAARRPR
jgi:hypothetical protein